MNKEIISMSDFKTSRSPKRCTSFFEFWYLYNFNLFQGKYFCSFKTPWKHYSISSAVNSIKQPQYYNDLYLKH